MDRIINKVETNCRFRPSSVELSEFDVVMCPKKFSGIAMDDCVLILNVHGMYSFRAQLPNLDSLPIVLFKRPVPVDRGFLQRYFAENHDNPYALFNAIAVLSRNQPVAFLSQLPPLLYSKDRTAFLKLAEMAEIGDVVFSFDRESNLARMIRRVDYSHWSHTAAYAGNGRLVEVTTGGLSETPIESLYRPSLDIGLYRPRVRPTVDQKAVMEDYIKASLKRGIAYDWMGVLRTYLRKRWRIPLRAPPTPGDLIYANFLELIAYA